MEQKHYKLRYLPLFVSDMEEIVDYITLQNPDAAYHFLERVEAAIWKRLEFPVSFEPYQGTGARNTHITEFMWGISLSIMWL